MLLPNFSLLNFISVVSVCDSDFIQTIQCTLDSSFFTRHFASVFLSVLFNSSCVLAFDIAHVHWRLKNSRGLAMEVV